MTNYKYSFAVFALFSIMVVAGFYGCSEENGTLNSSDAGNYESADFAILDFEDAMASLGDAGLDADMSFGEFPPGGDMGPRFGNRGDDRPPRGRHLKPIFEDLNLTADQIVSVREVMDGHKECMDAAVEIFREVNREIIEAANEERRSIHRQVVDGLITREEGHELLRELNERTREAIHNNPESILAHEEMCACKLALFDELRPIFDEVQQAVWDEWAAQLDGPCFEGG